jgi:hypothetical protein
MAPPRPQDQLLTPGKQPLSPQLDNSLITSTVRKRKGAWRPVGILHCKIWPGMLPSLSPPPLPI